MIGHKKRRKNNYTNCQMLDKKMSQKQMLDKMMSQKKMLDKMKTFRQVGMRIDMKIDMGTCELLFTHMYQRNMLDMLPPLPPPPSSPLHPSEPPPWKLARDQERVSKIPEQEAWAKPAELVCQQ